METKSPSLDLFNNNNIASVLLIDNEDIDLFVNKKLLESYGFSNIVAFKSADQALDFLKETKIIFQFIIVDIYMPIMDGFEFIDKFMALELNKKHGDICLLSASLNPTDKEKARAKNIPYLEKPLNIEELAEIKCAYNH